MCEDNRDPFIATLHNLLLAPYLCNGLFSIITLINLGHNFLFHKGVLHCVLRSKRENIVTLPYSAQRKHVFLGGIKEMSRTKKLPARNKITLELLHLRLGHRSTR